MTFLSTTLFSILVLFSVHALGQGMSAPGVPKPPVPPNPLPTIPVTQANFPNCSLTDQRTEKDGMCPRLEGSNLPHCCPPIEKRPAIECQYVKMIQRGQPTLINGSYTTCQNGVNVQVPCCQTSAQSCFENPVKFQFIQRLISRNKQCCVEPCPPPEYWSTPPAKPGLPSGWSGYTYYPGGSSQCTGTVLNQCTVAGGATCKASDFCPAVPAPTPTPGDQNPGGGPDPVTPSPPTTPTTPTPPVTQPPAEFGNG